ncbi:MAG TPA: DNA mismatch repair protein MutS, partial [Patescibacteria group bacterium]|nr:DNA mismatch repair protein MutS [Patescibacteria group bacterium]
MMAQYRRIKSELPKDALLFFRLGDFYELFFEDAQEGAQLLNVALTKRGVIPMCGIPFHAANAYIGRILKAGRKVAICDQVEEARPGQLVKREVTQILSPGTHFDERMLLAERNNFLAAVYPNAGAFGLAFADVTTGDFLTTEVEDDSALLAELQRLRPAEIVYPASEEELRQLLRSGSGSTPTDSSLSGRPRAGTGTAGPTSLAAAPGLGSMLCPYEDWVFGPETALFTVRDHFKVSSLDGFGLKDRPGAVGAAGAVLHYLTQHLRRDGASLTRISFYQRNEYLTLDYTTLRHLEVLEPLHHDAPRNACLYGALNRTVTPMGARRLRDWLSQPLNTTAGIRRRQQATLDLINNTAGLETFRKQLTQVRDLERTIGRLTAGTGNGRDLAALRVGLEQLPGLKTILRDVIKSSAAPAGTLNDEVFRDNGSSQAQHHIEAEGSLLVELQNQISEMPQLVEVLRRGIVDEPPLTVKDGGLIRDGFDSALDELRSATRGGKDWIARLQQEEMTKTGIQSLKVRFNSVFGYYIEVTKANLDKVPSHYVRKQTISNGERFITPELKEMEGKILGAEERSMKLEYELFQRVREEVLGRLSEIQSSAAALSQLDVLTSFAETARLFSYCRPHLGDEGILTIRNGRHPVLEQNLSEERFVPNDTCLSPAMQLALITGPNMAGKSTYIRQVALLTLLAHTGCFIPADEARIDLVDRIFTRIGASDDLARGQ